MDVDDERRSTNTSPSVTSSGQSGRPTSTPVLPRIVAAADASDSRHPGRQHLSHHEHDLRDPNSSAIRREPPQPYDPRHTYPPAPTSPTRRHYYPSEHYYEDRRRHNHPPYEHPYPSRPYSAVDLERHPYREPYPPSPRSTYSEYIPPRPSSALRLQDERYHHQQRRSLSPPRFRPVNRDQRDRSPHNRYPQYPEQPYPPRDPRDRLHSRSDTNDREYREYGHRPESPYPESPRSRQRVLEEFAQRADRWSHSLGRYVAPVPREPPRDTTAPFSSVHQGNRSNGYGDRGTGRDTILPPAREILSVSPERPTGAARGSRIIRVSRSMPVDTLFSPPQGPATYFGRRTGFESSDDIYSVQAPEEILRLMSLQAITRPSEFQEDSPRQGRLHPMSPRPMADRTRILGGISDLHHQHRSTSRSMIHVHEPPNTPTHHRSHNDHVPPIQPSRTGFPSSGLRSTAPATPPIPRTAQHDSRTTLPHLSFYSYYYSYPLLILINSIISTTLSRTFIRSLTTSSAKTTVSPATTPSTDPPSTLRTH